MGRVVEIFFQATHWLTKRRAWLEDMVGPPEGVSKWKSPQECMNEWNYYLEKKRRFNETIEQEFNDYCRKNNLSLKDINGI